MRRAEEAIAALEGEIAALTARLESPEVAADYAQLTALTAELEEKNSELETTLERWEQAQLALEELLASHEAKL